MSPDGTRLYAAHIDSLTVGDPDTVTVINTATNTVIATIPVGAQTTENGEGPARVAVSPDGTRAYVTNFSLADSSSVVVIDTVSNAVIATIPVAATPVGVVVSPDGAHAYVTHLALGTVSVIDTATDTVVATIPVGIRPAEDAISADGTHLYVANEQDDTVSVITLG
jgi:YVTN family beta-propeller protein